MVFRPEIGYKEFSADEVQLFRIIMCFKERKGEVHMSLAMSPPGSSATLTICTFRNTFSLEVLSMHLLKYQQKDELQ